MSCGVFVRLSRVRFMSTDIGQILSHNPSFHLGKELCPIDLGSLAQIQQIGEPTPGLGRKNQS